MTREEVIRLAEEGKSYREISEITGYSYAHIHRILKQEVEKRKKLLQERGESKVENVKSVVSELNKYVNEVDEKVPETEAEPEEKEKSVLKRPLKGGNLIFALLIAAAVVIAIAYFMRPKEKVVEKLVYLPPPVDETQKSPPRVDYVVI